MGQASDNMRKSMRITLFAASILLCSGLCLARTDHRKPFADLIWRKALMSGAEIPMRADMTIRDRVQGRTTVTGARVIQGPRGLYRVEFTAPAEARGRIVISDGRAFWAADPNQKLVVKTAVVTGTGQGARRTDPLIEKNYRIVLLSDHEMVAGRAAYLLELSPRLPGKSSQRRWIDRRTFKTLRIETRFSDGVLSRVIAYSHVTLPAPVSMIDFTFPSSTLRIVDRSTPSEFVPGRDLSTRARQLGLEPHGPLGFHLMQMTSGLVGDKTNMQLLYSDGVESISIFVQDGGQTAQVVPANWQRAYLNGTVVFRETTGHNSVLVWSGHGHRFTALSHLQPDTLWTFLESFLK